MLRNLNKVSTFYKSTAKGAFIARLEEATVNSKNMWISIHFIGYTGGLFVTGQFGQIIANKENSKLIQTKFIAIFWWFYLYSIFYMTIAQSKQRKVINNFPFDQCCVSSSNFLIVGILIRIVCLSCSRPQFRCPQSWQLWQLWRTRIEHCHIDNRQIVVIMAITIIANVAILTTCW